jgi:hypothetical protein
MPRITIPEERYRAFVKVLSSLKVPQEQEATTHAFKWNGMPDDLANCYLAIVSICHQTSPLGERRLEGWIDGQQKFGWDYLKEKYLMAAVADKKWSEPSHWAELSPEDLGNLFEDSKVGRTLNRVNERTMLLNDAGKRLVQVSCKYVRTSFEDHGRRLSGHSGFGNFLKSLRAYRDPVMKKTLFFTSLAVKECGWKLVDPNDLRSPVDYHELRGHLRIGTVVANDATLRHKVERGLVLTEEEDTHLRQKVQEVNDRAAAEAGITSSMMHYLCWNIFRNCCPRPSEKTHCSECGPQCKLPQQYKEMSGYKGRCVFASACTSASKPNKVIDPPYAGDFY